MVSNIFYRVDALLPDEAPEVRTGDGAAQLRHCDVAAQVRGYDTIFLFTLVATVTFNPSASDLLVFLSSSFLDL